MPYQPNENEVAWLESLHAVVNAARMVCALDGTDRLSIEALRDALYNFGVHDERSRDDRN